MNFFPSLCKPQELKALRRTSSSTVVFKRSLEPPEISCFQRIVWFGSLCLCRTLDLQDVCVSHILPLHDPSTGPWAPPAPLKRRGPNERDLLTPQLETSHTSPSELQAPESHSLKNFISAVYLERGVENKHVDLFRLISELRNVGLLNKNQQFDFVVQKRACNFVLQGCSVLLLWC